MAFVLSDRVKETSTSTGYSDLLLGGAFGGFQTFGLGVGDGNSTYYAIENSTRWEVGIGTYTSSTNTLSRDTVLASSSSDEKIYLDGVSYVFVTYPAGKAFILNPDGVATGISGHTGIAFPDGTTQTTAVYLSGVGFDGTIPFWDGTHSFTYDADLKWDSSSQTLINNQGTELSPTTKLPLKLTRTNAGNLFHAYVDNGWDRTVGLHLTDTSGPTWKLGLKSGPSSDTAAPDQGYVFGNNGSAGMYPASDTYFLMNYLDGFWVNHKGASMLNIDRAEGFNVDNNLPAVTAFTVKGAITQASNLQEWQRSDGTIMSSIDSSGVLVLNKQMTDNNAPNSSFYYSSDGGKLAFKSAAGSVSYWGTSVAGGARAYVNITADATITISDDLVFSDATAAPITITLPSAVSNGGVNFTIKKTDSSSNSVIISGSQTIDGQASTSLLHQNESLTVTSNNSTWFII
jgi:hypothetical protein